MRFGQMPEPSVISPRCYSRLYLRLDTKDARGFHQHDHYQQHEGVNILIGAAASGSVVDTERLEPEAA